MSLASGVDFSNESWSKNDDPFENHTHKPNFGSVSVGTNEITQDEFEKLAEKINDAKLNLQTVIADMQQAWKHENDNRPPKDKKSKPKDLVLLETINNLTSAFFKDQSDEPYAVIKDIQHEKKVYKNMRIFSEQYKDLIREHILKSCTFISKDKLKEILLHVKSLIHNEIILTPRLVRWNDEILYNLNDESRRIVKINRDGWSVEDSRPDVQFFRYLDKNQKQDLPSQDFDVNKRYIRELIERFPINNDNQKLVTEVALIALFLPDIEHPLLNVFGMEGSSKSTFMAHVKQIVDPRINATKNVHARYIGGGLNRLSDDNNGFQDRAIEFQSNYFVGFENLSYLKRATQDEFCMWAYGITMNKRKLFSDGDNYKLSAIANIGTTAVVDPYTRPDLMRRTLPIEFGEIEQSLGGKIVWNLFNKTKPELLGYVFSIISKYLATENVYINSIEPKTDFADFEISGEIISRCLGNEAGAFQEAWVKIKNSYSKTLFDKHPFAGLLVEYLETKRKHEIYVVQPEEFHNDFIEFVVNEKNLRNYKNTLPNDARNLTINIKRIKKRLLELGILWESKPLNQGRRYIFKFTDPRDLNNIYGNSNSENTNTT